MTISLADLQKELSVMINEDRSRAKQQVDRFGIDVLKGIFIFLPHRVLRVASTCSLDWKGIIKNDVELNERLTNSQILQSLQKHIKKEYFRLLEYHPMRKLLQKIVIYKRIQQTRGSSDPKHTIVSLTEDMNDIHRHHVSVSDDFKKGYFKDVVYFKVPVNQNEEFLHFRVWKEINPQSDTPDGDVKCSSGIEYDKTKIEIRWTKKKTVRQETTISELDSLKQTYRRICKGSSKPTVEELLIPVEDKIIFFNERKLCSAIELIVGASHCKFLTELFGISDSEGGFSQLMSILGAGGWPYSWPEECLLSVSPVKLRTETATMLSLVLIDEPTTPPIIRAKVFTLIMNLDTTTLVFAAFNSFSELISDAVEKLNRLEMTRYKHHTMARFLKLNIDPSISSIRDPIITEEQTALEESWLP